MYSPRSFDLFEFPRLLMEVVVNIEDAELVIVVMLAVLVDVVGVASQMLVDDGSCNRNSFSRLIFSLFIKIN